MHILVIEDEEQLCCSIAEGLRMNGYETDTCFDGDEGLELCLTENYDLILLDLNLPGIDGLEILRQFREINFSTPVLRLKDVAKRQEISDKYLEQIISILNKAGFVRSVRGPQGGYALQQTPDKYTVGMILRLTEGSLSPVECLDDNGAICDREENCVTQILWKKLDDAIKGVVDHITLEDLMNWQSVKADEYII